VSLGDLGIALRATVTSAHLRAAGEAARFASS